VIRHSPQEDKEHEYIKKLTQKGEGEKRQINISTKLKNTEFVHLGLLTRVICCVVTKENTKMTQVTQ
jgi:hypothetical protein